MRCQWEIALRGGTSAWRGGLWQGTPEQGVQSSNCLWPAAPRRQNLLSQLSNWWEERTWSARSCHRNMPGVAELVIGDDPNCVLEPCRRSCSASEKMSLDRGFYPGQAKHLGKKHNQRRSCQHLTGKLVSKGIGLRGLETPGDSGAGQSLRHVAGTARLQAGRRLASAGSAQVSPGPRFPWAGAWQDRWLHGYSQTSFIPRAELRPAARLTQPASTISCAVKGRG